MYICVYVCTHVHIHTCQPYHTGQYQDRGFTPKMHPRMNGRTTKKNWDINHVVKPRAGE